MQVWQIRKVYDLNTEGGTVRQGQMQRWLAEKLELSVGTIKKILTRSSWKKPYHGVTWEEWEKEHQPTLDVSKYF